MHRTRAALRAPDEDISGGKPGPGAAIPAEPPPPPAADPAKEPEQAPAWLKPRLEQARTSAQTDILKSLGVSSPEELKTALDRLKALDQEKLTAEEKSKQIIDELKPKASRADTLEATVKSYADRELLGLNDLQRASVVALAGDDPAQILKAIEALKPTWASAPAAPVTPQPASTSTGKMPDGKNDPPPPTDHKAIYAQLTKTNPFEAARYYQAHAKHIAT